MKISLGSWAFSFGPYASHPIPFDRIVRRLASAGYDGIEVCGFPPHITLQDHPDAASRRQVTDLLRHNGLGVSGYSANFSSVNPCVRENRARYLDLFRRNLEMCVDLGSPVIRVDAGSAPGSIDDSDYAAAMERLAEVWRDAAAAAEVAGVRVAWEFEPGFVFNKPSEVFALHALVAHRNFTVLFDTAHAHMCGVVGSRQQGRRETLAGGVSEFLHKLTGRIGAVHLTDSDGTLHGDETSTHRPLGEGCINFPALAPALLALPRVEWWCVDLCFWAGSWDLVERELEFVRGMLPKPVTSRR